MAIDTATFEATLDSKIDAATTSNSPTEFLLLAKAVEATNAAVSTASLSVANNLSDLNNAATARTNLGLGTMAVATASDYATQANLSTSVSALVDSAPGTLDTLNELAAALGDDANFSTTVTNSIATKLPLAGGTLTGAITAPSMVLEGDLRLDRGATDAASVVFGPDYDVQIFGDGTAQTLTFMTGNSQRFHVSNTGAAVTGGLSVSGNVSGSYTNLHPEVTTANVSSSQTIDMTKPMHHFDMTAATAFSGVSIAAGRTSMMVLDTTATPHTPTWGSDIKWPGATEPTWADSRYWIVSMTCLDGSIILASASGYTV